MLQRIKFSMSMPATHWAEVVLALGGPVGQPRQYLCALQPWQACKPVSMRVLARSSDTRNNFDTDATAS